MPYTTNADIKNRFSYHAPTDDKIVAHSQVREDSLLLAYSFNELLPESAEKTLAIRKIEEAMFWANAAIARNNGKPELPPALFALPNAS